MSIKEPPLDNIDINEYTNKVLEYMNGQQGPMDEQVLTQYVMNLIEEKFNLIESLENLEVIQIRVSKKCIKRINNG